jgi:hypothetical protein
MIAINQRLNHRVSVRYVKHNVKLVSLLRGRLAVWYGKASTPVKVLLQLGRGYRCASGVSGGHSTFQ